VDLIVKTVVLVVDAWLTALKQVSLMAR
jgi:hypothetical protein